MGLWDKIAGEFIDIIEFLDARNDTLSWRFERYGNEIKNNAQLIVREGQVAIFINEGKFADAFGPGRHVLSTENMPILSTLKGWKYGFESPFKAEVYFVSTRSFTDMKWGTRNPIILRDPEIGPIRVRAYGTYQFRIVEPRAFLTGLVGVDEHFTVEELTPQLRNIIVTRFSSMIASAELSALDMAANIDQLSDLLRKRVGPELASYGVELESLLVENISLPPKVEEMLDKRSSMGLVGDLGRFSQFQAAVAMENISQSEAGGGLAGAGLGAGMGMALAHQMGGALGGGAQHPGAFAPPPPPAGSVLTHVLVNGQAAGPYPMQALSGLVASGQLTASTLVWQPGMAQWAPASQVASLGMLFGAVPPPPPPGVR